MTVASQPGTKTVNFYDPVCGFRVEKNVFPPPLPTETKAFSSGMTVQEIGSMDQLKSLWRNNITADLRVPLDAHSRRILREELRKAFTDKADLEAVDQIADTWQPTDDRMLKVLGRLLTNAGGHDMNLSTTVDRLNHEKALWLEERRRLLEERAALTADVNKLLEENAKLLRGQTPALGVAIAEKAALTSKIGDLENTLSQTIRQKADVERERDILRRDAQRNVQIALDEYETQVVRKLTKVAEEHKATVAENTSLKGEVRRLMDKMATQEATNMAKDEVAKMDQTEQAEAPVEKLRSGDEVYCKVSGEGPFVLVAQVDEAQVEFANPIAGRKNSFHCGKLPVYDVWVARCKDASFRTLPAPTLTKTPPKSNLSLAGLKGVVTSDVTAKLVQYIVWGAIIAMMYAQRVG